MFLVSGALIAAPGQIASPEIAAGTKVTLALADEAALPLIIGVVVALVLALVMKETYPRPAPGSVTITKTPQDSATETVSE